MEFGSDRCQLVLMNRGESLFQRVCPALDHGIISSPQLSRPFRHRFSYSYPYNMGAARSYRCTTVEEIHVIGNAGGGQTHELDAAGGIKDISHDAMRDLRVRSVNQDSE